ncbi:MAG: hypothetical protein RBR78_02565 [Flavobacteriaceae bacterium]|jgi:hypothetical protein|nr:hypothetical protein [Flavobacteriaceae bacterium]HTO35619.1 hypothetical protein [Flavobacterium sp.]
MKTNQLLIIFCAFLFLGTTVQAQILKRMKDKVNQSVERTIERKVEQKAEKTTEKAMDDILEGNPDKKDSNKQKAGNNNDYLQMAQQMQAGMADATYEKSYVFSSKVVSQFENTKGRKTEKSKLTQWYGDNAQMTVTDQDSDSKMITDFKNKSSVMLNEKDKTGVAVSMNFMSGIVQQATDAAEDTEDKPLNFRKTGNTRTIAGYTAEEYMAEDDEMTMRAWFSKKADFGFEKSAENMMQLFGLSNLPKDMNPYGTMLRYEGTSKKDKETTVMEVISIEKTKTTVETSQYKFQKF